MHSVYAKALAVKKVTLNKCKDISGVDKHPWSTPSIKIKATLSLTDMQHKAKPIRRVYIEKKDKKKKRPLGIPTMYDRTMQTLYAFALESMAEVNGDKVSITHP